MVHFDVGFTSDLNDLLRASAEVLRKDTYGTVYKAELENGTIVFVRRFGVEMTKDQKNFKAEIAVLGKIRHPNLLAPIACHVGRDEKLIIMDYMPRGSLSDFLHG
nr:unnamed protein product [Digitaria exilis]